MPGISKHWNHILFVRHVSLSLIGPANLFVSMGASSLAITDWIWMEHWLRKAHLLAGQKQSDSFSWKVYWEIYRLKKFEDEWVMVMAGHFWVMGTAVAVPKTALASALSKPCCSMFPWLNDLNYPLSFQ